MAYTSQEQPPLPTYTLTKEPDLFTFISDRNLALILPIVSYVIISIFWAWIDSLDIWEQYRLHPTEDMLKRNRISKFECVRGVAVYHAVAFAATFLLTWGDPMETFSGDEAFACARWASYLRALQASIPQIFSIVGIDSVGLADRLSGSSLAISGLLRGGIYPNATQLIALPGGGKTSAPGFLPWENAVASTMYYIVVPIFQFLAAFFIADTWFYFMHRFFHMNKWLYKNVHSIHHKLYVTYAYGAVYAHPLEGLAIDTIAFTLGIILSGLTPRQTMVFNILATWKATNDHCGYVLPWDPFTFLTGNTSKYHDVHHQTWGLKNNYAIFFTFWDRLFDTERTYEEQEKKHKQIVDEAKTEMKTEFPETAKTLLAKN
ncbi:MAG: hypothetical protein Q9172_005797 [Xanthocarpia lactea]